MRPTIDTYKHKGQRQRLIESLLAKGITNTTVLEALSNTPRHFFLDSAFEQFAYEERAFTIVANQTISHPYTVAYQTQLLQLSPYQKVLEIGTGSGYQACVLAQLKVNLYTIERQRDLYDINKKFEYLLSFKNITQFYRDGFEGLPTFAPFDRILITAAAPIVPPKLLEQLKPQGCMVIPLGEGTTQCMQRITKQTDGTFVTELFDNFSFVPMLSGKNG